MIISVSGRIGSGKDLVGRIIQGLILGEELFVDGIRGFLEFYGDYVPEGGEYSIHKWADSLKEMLCIMTGTKREQWEDADFKNTELPQEWWYWKVYSNISKDKFELIPYDGETGFYKRKENYQGHLLVKPTPRLLLQLLGTECGRNIIHPNVWVLALMSKYIQLTKYTSGNNAIQQEDGTFKIPEGHGEHSGKLIDSHRYEYQSLSPYPNWIITDTRFPNELQAVKDRGGISIKVVRSIKHQIEAVGGITDIPEDAKPTHEHESETALDNAQFDEVIDNNEDISELIEKVKEILIRRGILCQEN